eukprot:gb/GFBE01018517.1/.p1 GENE.gb/GFBE01018517.1/~~gb/GFBE01018517.1/.p1  ORF type:complete len:310 (+),score=33.87 gb/GFBE01018517.1/:1-930(+)
MDTTNLVAMALQYQQRLRKEAPLFVPSYCPGRILSSSASHQGHDAVPRGLPGGLVPPGFEEVLSQTLVPARSVPSGLFRPPPGLDTTSVTAPSRITMTSSQQLDQLLQSWPTLPLAEPMKLESTCFPKISSPEPASLPMPRGLTCCGNSGPSPNKIKSKPASIFPASTDFPTSDEVTGSSEDLRSMCSTMDTSEDAALSLTPGGKQDEQQAVQAPRPPGYKPAIGSPERPSVGSVRHRRGKCKPCAFFRGEGCASGVACLFCHLCEAGEKKKRKKDLKERKRTRLASLESAALTPSVTDQEQLAGPQLV